MKTEILSNLCEIVIGRTPARDTPEYWGKGYPWVSIADLKEKHLKQTKEQITQTAIESIRCRLIPKGTLLLSFKLSIGKMSFANSDLYTNEAIAGLIIKDNKKLSSEYLFHALKVTNFLGSNQAAMGKTLNSKSLAVIKIPFPPIDDQIRIATLLSRVETLITTRKNNLRLLDELVKSTFLEMFGEPVEMKKYPLDTLGKYIDFLTSGSRGWAQYYSVEGTDVFLRINNVRNATLKLDDLIYVNPPNSTEAIRTKTQEGDLLLSITADLGRTAVVSKKIAGAFINQHLALIRLKKERLNPIYVAWFFAMPFGKSIINQKNKEGVKAGLNFDDIKSFNLFVPSLELQTQFAAIVEKTERLKNHYQQSLRELENLYHALSGQAFQGELDLSRVPLS